MDSGLALRAAVLKYNSPVDKLTEVAERFAGDLASIDKGEEKLKALELTAKKAEADFRTAAETLSAARSPMRSACASRACRTRCRC